MDEEKKPRISQSGDTRVRILDAAIDLFSINGYSGVSIRDIARAVGIKESSIYNHFSSKEALLDEMFTLYDQESAGLIPSEELSEQVLNTITPQQFWENGFRQFKEVMGSARTMKLARILTMEIYRSERAREILLKNSIEGPIAFAEKIFRKLMERGQIRTMDAARLAVSFQAALFALYVEYLALQSAGQDTRKVEQQVKNHIRFFSELVSKGDEV